MAFLALLCLFFSLKSRALTGLESKRLVPTLTRDCASRSSWTWSGSEMRTPFFFLLAPERDGKSSCLLGSSSSEWDLKSIKFGVLWFLKRSA